MKLLITQIEDSPSDCVVSIIDQGLESVIGHLEDGVFVMTPELEEHNPMAVFMAGGFFLQTANAMIRVIYERAKQDN